MGPRSWPVTFHDRRARARLLPVARRPRLSETRTRTPPGRWTGTELPDELHVVLVPVPPGSGERSSDDLGGALQQWHRVAFSTLSAAAHVRLRRR